MSEVMDQIKSEKHPKVSIGMPVYNGEKYIREALDSLLAQTFIDFELIISDNASTDGTGSICREYEAIDKRIRYVRQSENKGALDNFKFVLDEATGEYFMWAACDDMWDRKWLESLYDDLAISLAGAAFGQIIVINEFSHPIPHIALGNTFDFTGPRCLRRICYYLESEGKGKANLFYSLFKREDLLNMKISSYKTDFVVIFGLLNLISIRSVDGVVFYKRHHNDAAGYVFSERKTVLRKIVRFFIPIHLDLLREYFDHSSYIERFLLLILIPLKYLIAYIAYFEIFRMRKKEGGRCAC